MASGGRHGLIFFRLRAANTATQDVLILPVARFGGVGAAEQAPRATQARLGLGRKAVQMADIAEVHYTSAEVGSDLPAAPVALVLHELLPEGSKGAIATHARHNVKPRTRAMLAQGSRVTTRTYTAIECSECSSWCSVVVNLLVATKAHYMEHELEWPWRVSTLTSSRGRTRTTFGASQIVE